MWKFGLFAFLLLFLPNNAWAETPVSFEDLTADTPKSEQLRKNIIAAGAQGKPVMNSIPDTDPDEHRNTSAMLTIEELTDPSDAGEERRKQIIQNFEMRN